MSDENKKSFAEIQKNFFSVVNSEKDKASGKAEIKDDVPSLFDFDSSNPEAIIIAGCSGGSGDGGSSGSDPGPGPGGGGGGK